MRKSRLTPELPILHLLGVPLECPASICLTRAFHEPDRAKQKAHSSDHALRWKMRQQRRRKASIWDPKPCTPLFSRSSLFFFTPTPQESSEWL